MNKLETERLLLKTYTKEDKESFIRLLTDEVVMKYVDTGVYSVEKAESSWKKLSEELYPQDAKTIFAVFDKDDERFVGNASIRPRPAKKEEWEISYILRSEEWGKGFATEIAKRLIKFGFNKLNLSEVFATIDDDNFDSIKVAEKAAMTFLHYEFDEEGRFSVYSIRATA